MPGGDGTGPGGMGPMTGRAAGYCAGYPTPGFMNPVGGRGFFGGGGGFGGGGWGRGFGGRGRRNRFYATGMPGWMRAGYGTPYPAAGGYGMPSAAPFPPYGAYGTAAPAPEGEIEMLKGQAEYLEDALDGIKKRIEEIEASKAKT